MDISYDVVTFISKFLYFKKIYSSNFADIIIKTTFKDSKKVKRIRSYV